MIAWAYGLFLITTILIFFYDRIKYKRVWYDPLYFFLSFMLLYVSPLSLRYIYQLPIKGNVTPYFYDIAEVFPYSLILTNIAVFVFYITYLLSPTFQWQKYRLINHNQHNYTILNKISYVVFLLGLLVLFLSAQSFGGIKKLLSMGYSVTTVLSQQPIISFTINIMISASFLMMTTYAISRKKHHFLSSLLMIVPCFIMLIIMSRRAELIVWTTTYILFYSLSIKPIQFKLILPLLLMGFITLNILGLSRICYTYKNNMPLIQCVVQENKKVGTFYTLTTGQFSVPYETLPVLMKFNNEPLRYGSTLTDIVVQWIPRAIYPEKDYGIAVWYYHEFYDKYAPPNVGRTFFFLSEGYLNFGVIGIFIWAALWGLFWKNIAYLQKYNNFLFYFIFSIYTSSMIILINNYSAGLFVSIVKTYILWFLLPYLLYLVLIHMKSKKECIK